MTARLPQYHSTLLTTQYSDSPKTRCRGISARDSYHGAPQEWSVAPGFHFKNNLGRIIDAEVQLKRGKQCDLAISRCLLLWLCNATCAMLHSRTYLPINSHKQVCGRLHSTSYWQHDTGAQYMCICTSSARWTVCVVRLGNKVTSCYRISAFPV